MAVKVPTPDQLDAEAQTYLAKLKLEAITALGKGKSLDIARLTLEAVAKPVNLVSAQFDLDSMIDDALAAAQEITPEVKGETITVPEISTPVGTAVPTSTLQARAAALRDQITKLKAQQVEARKNQILDKISRISAELAGVDALARTFTKDQGGLIDIKIGDQVLKALPPELAAKTTPERIEELTGKKVVKDDQGNIILTDEDIKKIVNNANTLADATGHTLVSYTPVSSSSSISVSPGVQAAVSSSVAGIPPSLPGVAFTNNAISNIGQALGSIGAITGQVFAPVTNAVNSVSSGVSTLINQALGGLGSFFHF